jgi:hypothetical protein
MHDDFWHSLEHAFPTARSPQSSSKQKGGIEAEGSRANCSKLTTYTRPAAPAGDDRDMFGGVLLSFLCYTCKHPCL